MKKVLGVVIALVLLAISLEANAGAKWPDKGWHKGFYLTGNVGMMQVTNDRHAVTRKKFDGPFNPSFGLTLGWDVADWIGPQIQINFATAKAKVGDPANATAVVVYPDGFSAAAGTFPVQDAREYALNFGLYARATLPYFTRASWQGEKLKFIPYLKLGGVGHALFVNASNNNNKIAAYGGGIGIGAGAEVFIWKGIIFCLDATEHIIFQGSYMKTINDSTDTPRRVKFLEGGTKPQFNLTGMFGYHF